MDAAGRFGANLKEILCMEGFYFRKKDWQVKGQFRTFPHKIKNEYSPFSSHGWMSGDRQMNFTAVYQKFPKGYVAFVEELPGANTQGKTLE